MTSPRIGVASIMQESNTFAPTTTTFADFEAHAVYRGAEMLALRGANTEAAGAFDALERRGVQAVPVVRTSALSGGPLRVDALDRLGDLLRQQLATAGRLDGLLLSLHGALVTEDGQSADAALLRCAVEAVGAGCPVAVCLDLHAHVTPELVEPAAFVIGYRTYPHVDQAETGGRATDLLLDMLEGSRTPTTVLAKRSFISNAEAQGAEGPLGDLRRAADLLVGADGALADISLFPVQPWLDVAGLGFAVTVTAEDPERAANAAETIADQAWERRRDFVVELVDPAGAIDEARARSLRPVVISESADAPPGGAAGDSPAMVRAFLEHGADLRALMTLVDAPAVEACTRAGEGARVSLRLGASIDTRFHEPVNLEGVVGHIGDAPYTLSGSSHRGIRASMGRYARLDVGRLSILITERPALTFDPATFRHVGLDPDEADAVVVRSANLFRANWGACATDTIFLDLPGSTTPRFATLDYRRAARPLYPLDDV